MFHNLNSFPYRITKVGITCVYRAKRHKFSSSCCKRMEKSYFFQTSQAESESKEKIVKKHFFSFVSCFFWSGGKEKRFVLEIMLDNGTLQLCFPENKELETWVNQIPGGTLERCFKIEAIKQRHEKITKWNMMPGSKGFLRDKAETSDISDQLGT